MKILISAMDLTVNRFVETIVTLKIEKTTSAIEIIAQIKIYTKHEN